jgi:hypothetical protein
MQVVILTLTPFQAGSPVEGARVKASGIGVNLTADQFGRAFFRTRRRENLSITITKEGRQASFSGQCIDDREVVVRMR